MKKIILLLTTLSLMACSTDDGADAVSNVDYFPLKTGNNWTYQNEVMSSNGTTDQSTETLSVSSVSMQGGQNIYQLESDLNQPTLSFTNIITNGDLRKNNGQLIFNGTLSLDLNTLAGQQLNLDPINIEVSNAILYDSGANSGANLFTKTEQFTQNITVQGTEVPLNINYTLETTQEEFLMAYSVNDVEYNDVISSSIRLNVEASFDVFVSIPIIDNQEVLKSTNYFAADTGLIFSDNLYSISTNAVEEFQIPEMNTTVESNQKLQSLELP
jgi:hypothetical protein